MQDIKVEDTLYSRKIIILYVIVRVKTYLKSNPFTQTPESAQTVRLKGRYFALVESLGALRYKDEALAAAATE